MVTVETFGHDISRLSGNQASSLMKNTEMSKPSLGMVRMSSVSVDGK